jgi:uncharacterized protein YbjT (DUF2867 family)
MASTSPMKPHIVIAGASGFIGRSLGPALHDDFHTIALSRRAGEPGPGYDAHRQVDLFSLSGSTAALEGADYAVYLVHSMMPSARLVQGHFSDLDVLCADNFARGAANAGVRHIVYVGGLIPSATTLSEHLESRQEVETALANTGIPVTTLRAGMIVGAHGSSYQLLARLVRRLPVMATPSWTRSRMHPVALEDVVRALGHVLQEDVTESRVFDLAAPEAVSYQELMRATAASLGLKRRFIPVPLLSPRLSRLWVSLTTGAPKPLVAPLVESLKHDMLARPEARMASLPGTPKSVEEMLADAAQISTREKIVPRAFLKPGRTRQPSTVCSVQRMELPDGCDAAWAANTYFRWVTSFMRGVIKVVASDTDPEIKFIFTPTGHKLLGLLKLPERSSADRQVMKVTAGLLARTSERGRLEFRRVLGKKTLVAALHDFVPRLPWWLYRATQGAFHR